MKFSDIPQFPFASYRVNMPWIHIQDWLDNQGAYFNLDMNPPYQRGYVWTEGQKTAYIEYRLKGGFSGKDIFWNNPMWNNIKGKGSVLEIVDGKQRVQTVLDFLNNKVVAFGRFLKDFEDELPLIHYDLIFHINNLKTPKEVVEWYLGMNTGGSIHTHTDLIPAYLYLKTLTDETQNI